MLHPELHFAPPSALRPPLVVDLDGTLTPTDTLVESVIELVKHSPLSLLKIPFKLLQGRAGFKQWVAANTHFSATNLPYNLELLAYLRAEQQQGRRIILATAAHNKIAASVASHLALFDTVLASDSGTNLKGENKLKAIEAIVGPGFVYAGDSSADLPIWKAAQAAVLVGVAPALAASVRADVAIELELGKPALTMATWFKALRVHQWLKNLLLFVPLLTGFSFLRLDFVATIGLAFLSFSLAASATYLINDLWDLESDRAHPRKRERPFACGQIPVLKGIAMAGALLAAGIGLAMCISTGFTLMLLAYVVLTTAYSLVFKEYVLIDVILLSLLYTFRILAGTVAIGMPVSSWLLAFSVFIFLSLALVKRCSELVSLQQRGQLATRGRNYSVSDLVVLWPLGMASATSAVVVFGLFISAPATEGRYGTPALLWLVAVGLIYWLSRLWIKTSRGEMHDDPIIYALKNRGSRITITLMGAIMLAAHFLDLENVF